MIKSYINTKTKIINNLQVIRVYVKIKIQLFFSHCLSNKNNKISKTFFNLTNTN